MPWRMHFPCSMMSIFSFPQSRMFCRSSFCALSITSLDVVTHLKTRGCKLTALSSCVWCGIREQWPVSSHILCRRLRNCLAKLRESRMAQKGKIWPFLGHKQAWQLQTGKSVSIEVNTDWGTSRVMCWSILPGPGWP